MDLTKGNIYKQLITLAIPLLIGNILQQFYNAADVWIIGRYAGLDQFAAAGVAGSLMNLFIFLVVGACSGISILFAQLYGGKRTDDFRTEHFQSLTVGLGLAASLALFGILLMPLLIKVMKTPVELQSYIRTYMLIILLGLPFTFLYNMYTALLRAVGNTRVPLIILLFSVCTNLFMDLYLVRNLQMGIRGAAIATTLAQATSAILCMFYVYMSYRELMPRKENCHIEKGLLQQTFSLSSVTAVHQVSLYIGKLCVQGTINACGTDMITAYTATTRIEAFVNSFGDSCSSSSSVCIAQNYGANNHRRVKEVFYSSIKLFLILSVLCMAALYFASGPAVRLMLSTNQGVAFEEATRYLKTVALFYFGCIGGNALVGYYKGIGKPGIVFIGSASHITMRVILSILWIRSMGLRAVGLATGLGWVWVIIFWIFLYFRKYRKFPAKSGSEE